MIETAPHTPVLLKDTIFQLLTNPNGIYLDCTVGYGGHAIKIAEQLTSNGQLIGMDLDRYALKTWPKAGLL